MEYLAKAHEQRPHDLLAAIQNKEWNCTQELWNQTSEELRDMSYIEYSLANIKYFQARLNQIGFTGLERVVDAGCSGGRWTLALATLNAKVEAFDFDQKKVSFVEDMIKSNHAGSNASVFCGSTENLPFENESVDAIFCYSVIMFVDLDKTLTEFSRVLKKKGRLYINYNHWGWYLNMMLNRGLFKLKKRNFMTGLLYSCRTLLPKRNKNFVITNDFFRSKLNEYGLDIIEKKPEGHINISGDDKKTITPIHKPYQYGLPSVVEVLAQKNG